MTALESFTTLRFPSLTPRSRLEDLLAHVADVRAGEGVVALLLTCNLFLLLGAYYMLKTAREALILSQGGAEVKSYSSAGQALLLLAIVPLYGVLASRVSRVRLVYRGHAVLRFESARVHRLRQDGLSRRRDVLFVGGSCSTCW
jgi:hypothetical protein